MLVACEAKKSMIVMVEIFLEFVLSYYCPILLMLPHLTRTRIARVVPQRLVRLVLLKRLCGAFVRRGRFQLESIPRRRARAVRAAAMTAMRAVSAEQAGALLAAGCGRRGLCG